MQLVIIVMKTEITEREGEIKVNMRKINKPTVIYNTVAHYPLTDAQPIP